MKIKTCLPLACLLVSPLSHGQGTAAAAGAVYNSATAPALAPPSPAISPDPAATAVAPQGEMQSRPSPAAPWPHGAAVELSPPTPPADTGACDVTDCDASQGGAGGKSKPATINIGQPAQRALQESHDWAENPRAMPSRDSGGRVMFPFSESAPTLVCAPIHVCDLELQAGETIQGMPHVGDSVRWRISAAASGGAAQPVIHLIIKPTEPGLDTNLIIPTDRHTYHIRLVSSSTRYVSSVGFYYPDDDRQTWAAAGGAKAAASETIPDMPTVAVNRLNFNYKISVVKGRPRFKPLRAMDDGYHTYISMNEDLPQIEAPVLVAVSPKGTEQIINYRLKGNLYVIDGTLGKLALISGVGREQERIELTRDPCKTRGWLGLCWDARE